MDDFGNQARETAARLFCVGRVPDRPCRALAKAMELYKRRHLVPMTNFLRKTLPTKVPHTVLYPFSGGDLLAAQTVFPGRHRFVLLSLEQGGTPDPLHRMTPVQQRNARRRFLRHASRTLRLSYSHTKDLLEPEGLRIPGLLPMILLGLRVHGGRVVGLRYFRLTPKGRVVYFTRAELAASGPWPRVRKSARKQWGRIYADPGYNRAYSNLELRYRLPGDATDRVLQHIAADISNPGLRHAAGLEGFLRGLGKRALMIKAASFLLWKKRYSRIRELVTLGASLVLADSSAPYPAWLRSKGFRLRLFGNFQCPIIAAVKRRAKPWIRAFGRKPRPKLPFRFGYRDCKQQNHMILARRD